MEDIRKIVPQIMNQNGYDVEIQNIIYQLHNNAISKKSDVNGDSENLDGDEVEYECPELPAIEEKLNCVQQARASWAAFVQEQLLSISYQLGKPLIVI